MGDSSIRAFGRRRKNLSGMSISGFGGMDILEAICLLQAGKISRDCDISKGKIRNRFQTGKDEFPTIRFCKHCYSDCMSAFEGDLILVLGLNNSLKADREPFANEYGRNMQDINGMFRLFDKVLKKMLPKAQVQFAPVLMIRNEIWRRSTVKLEVRRQINANIMERNHLQFDPNGPLNLNYFDEDGTHMDDFKSIEFWTEVFTSEAQNSH